MAGIFLVVHSWYPYARLPAVQARFAEIVEEKGTSDALKSILMFRSASERGMHVTAYHEVEEENMAAALRYLAEFMSGFWSIDGYTYTIEFAANDEQSQDFASRISKYALKQ
jgi:hypothetical protein